MSYIWKVAWKSNPLSHKIVVIKMARFYFIFLNYHFLFIYFWLRWVFVAAHGLSLVAASGGYSGLGGGPLVCLQVRN